MSITFNADEIFEMAEEIERNGAKFYRRAAKNAADRSSGAILLKLAEMEDQHEKTFAAMRKELPPRDQAPTAFDPDSEAALYLQSIADGHVFNVNADPSRTLTGRETAAQVLKIAIGLEKDSIVFYLGMQNLVGKMLGRDRIGGIMKEELEHITLLSGELAKAQS
jgi:rubrerythrin